MVKYFVATFGIVLLVGIALIVVKPDNVSFDVPGIGTVAISGEPVSQDSSSDIAGSSDVHPDSLFAELARQDSRLVRFLQNLCPVSLDSSSTTPDNCTEEPIATIRKMAENNVPPFHRVTAEIRVGVPENPSPDSGKAFVCLGSRFIGKRILLSVEYTSRQLVVEHGGGFYSCPPDQSLPDIQLNGSDASWLFEPVALREHQEARAIVLGSAIVVGG